ncbi:hypothetical protein PCC9214_04724 [Planktothrix tepida]|uniref:Uncharacterized protein n=3 Tax=Planktothrix TaxID=54304 RepID=A0A1J1LMF2_9CYAN|nr:MULTISPECIES: hypothetical protein [Planktothrix]MBD2480796.1 hypothetical protein [Planktothrix sp. FACHB-1365]MBE9145061.1 hypothetical protein [Planktothrix mougeotii LEGE 06226]CAD5922118.1 hypothetical protein NO713_00731 [Planktothrix pseudagardhii]CAD5980925.1 hypothetical protein PCC9214_04724 [Planktothrix tepida]CUR33712.1 conserved exported hypothetical protein [Planktothrix tepida PCC 9214]
MQFLKVITASLLVPVGMGCLLAIATELINPHSTADSKLSIILGGLILGLPSLGIGGWVAWDWYQERSQKIQARSRRIRSIFWHLVQVQGGEITVQKLAQYTHLSRFEAKAFLDQKAQELNGTFEKKSNGEIIYHFQVE